MLAGRRTTRGSPGRGSWLPMWLLAPNELLGLSDLDALSEVVVLSAILQLFNALPCLLLNTINLLTLTSIG